VFSHTQPSTGIFEVRVPQREVNAAFMPDVFAGCLLKQGGKLAGQVFHGDQFLQAGAVSGETTDLPKRNIMGLVKGKLVGQVDDRQIGWIGEEAGEAFDASL